MSYSRILTLQDISCVGQCSGSVALPILSACGQEACILPTAVLSSHTGGFKNPHIRILSEDITAAEAHWLREGLNFDFIYTGYLGSMDEIREAGHIMDSLLAKNGKIVVDPAMADNGKLYRRFDEAYASAMTRLCRKADVMIPNITEAAMMTGMPYLEAYDWDYIRELIAKLGASGVILTGVSFSPDSTGIAVGLDGQIQYYSHKKIPKSYHGTGDIFASSFVGAWASGKNIYEAASIAADFTCRCIGKTYENPAHWYGVKFEPELAWLIRKLSE